MKSKAIDISIPVFPGMTVYPGECETVREFHLTPGPGQPCTCTHWSMTAHAGTHLDAPSHFVSEKQALSDYGVDYFNFRAAVVDGRALRAGGRHADADFFRSKARLLEGCDAALLKTHDGELWRGAFDPSHTAIAPDGAEWLAERAGLRLVGIDYFSVEIFGSEPARTHLAILGAGLLILEGIDLSGVDEGVFRLECPPVRWQSAEAAPCRAILYREE